jgi:hypothetical protein
VDLLTDSFFNEFTVRLSKPAADGCRGVGGETHPGWHPGSRLIPGHDDLLIIAVTEVNTEADMRRPGKGPQRGAVMSDWSKALSSFEGGPAENMPTMTGNRGLMLEEPLIFEQGEDGRTGVDLPPEPPVGSKLGGLARKAQDRPARPVGAAGGAALYPPQPAELRDRCRAVPARFLHDEA